LAAKETTLYHKHVDHFENKAKFIYQMQDVTQSESITTLLTYSPPPINNVNYTNFEPEKWRIRSSSPSIGYDLKQTNLLNLMKLLNNAHELSSTKMIIIVF
jgi:hypothetical protein